MARLLSAQEIESAIISRGEDTFYKPSAWIALAEAQDAKTKGLIDAGWVEWAFQPCPHVDSVTNCFKVDCGLCWQAREKVVGL